MNSFSISGEGPEWHVFKRRSQDERPVIVRSRLVNAPLREFANANFLGKGSLIGGACALIIDPISGRLTVEHE